MKKIVSVFILILFAIDTFAQISDRDAELWKAIDQKFHQIQQMFTSQESVSYERYQVYENELLQLLNGTERNQTYAVIMAWLAHYNSSLEHYAEAIKFCTASCEIIKKELGETHPDYASSLGELASYYSFNGNYNEAIITGEKAIAIYNNTQSENYHPFYATVLSGLANDYYYIHDYENAIKHGTKALEINKITVGNTHPKYAESLDNLAHYYSSFGNYDKAVDLGANAMEIYQKTMGKDNEIYFKSLYNQANYYSQLGKYREAVTLETEAMEIAQRLFGKDHPFYASTLGYLSNYYSHLKDYERAVIFGSEAMSLLKNSLGSENPVYATFLSNLADDYYHLGNYSEAYRLETNACEIYKESLGGEHPDYIQSLKNLSIYSAYLGKYDNAIRFGSDVVMMYKKTLGENNPDYAKALSDLAAYYAESGNYNEASKLQIEAIEIQKKVLDETHPDYAKSIHNLAVIQVALGYYDKAITLENKALEIRKSIFGDNHQDYAISLNNLANCYSNLGDYAEAILIGNEAIEIIKKSYGEKHPNYASFLSDIADNYFHLGNYTEAIKYETEAMTIRRIVLGVEHPNYALSLNNLALYISFDGRYNEAIILASEAMENIKRYLGHAHPYYATTLSNIAQFYSHLGEYSEAIKYETEALEIRKSILGLGHPDHARSLSNLACYYGLLGKYSKAIELELRAIDIKEKTLGEEHPDIATSLSNIASFCILDQNYDEALNYLDKSTNIISNYLISQFGTLSSKERISLWNDNSLAICTAYPWLVSKSKTPDQKSGNLYDKSALFAKGLLLNSDVELSRFIEDTQDSVIINEYKKLKEMHAMQTKLYEMALEQRPFNIDSIGQAAQMLEMDLMKKSKVFGDFTRRIRFTWRDVQDALSDEDIAIEFLSYYDKDSKDMVYCALTLKKEYDIPKLHMLFKESTFIDDIQDNTTPISGTRLIWGTLLKELYGIKNIYFSPSGYLNLFPIEFLPLDDGSLMSDHYCMYRLSSTRELVTHKPSSTISRATIYGGLDYDASSKELFAANQGIKVQPSLRVSSNLTAMRSLEESSLRAGCVPLEGTRREAEFISKELKNAGITAIVYKDSQGTEESFKALSGNCPSLLHIGTHGFYWTPDEAEQRKQMSDNMKFLGGDDKRVQAEDKALSRSGLMMAGCNRVFNDETLPEELDDGILTAKEISQLDLRGLDLVVLSACETALGDISGSEGVFGLQRAFKKAGAQAIMMSLWKVDDVATENMMKFFYTHLAKGESIRQSFTAAQQELRAIDPDPRHWAAFILMDALD